MGLRELKKQKTRLMLSDLAVGLFMDKGYDAVTMADVAAAAEVSISTVFNYFSRKESLVFDLEDEIEGEILAAVRERRHRQSILAALREYFVGSQMFAPSNVKMTGKFMKLIRSSAELESYYRGLWARYETSLAREIQRSDGVSKVEAGCLARLVLEGVSFAFRSPSPCEALELMFDVLEKGWKK
jgi:AcrR family transcriptional regulator